MNSNCTRSIAHRDSTPIPSEAALAGATAQLRTRTLRGACAAAALAAVSSLASACVTTEPPRCGGAPSEPIHGFVVTTVTGRNATDMNIDFCFRRKSNQQWECTEIDDSRDNFEEWQTDEFELMVPPIAIGDLSGFQIRNTGGGFFENSWDLAGLTVEATLESGLVALLYEDHDVDVNLERGDAFEPDACSY